MFSTTYYPKGENKNQTHPTNKSITARLQKNQSRKALFIKYFLSTESRDGEINLLLWIHAQNYHFSPSQDIS